MIKYTVFESIVTVDTEQKVTYGIRAEKRTRGVWRTVREVCDLSSDREEVLSLCKKCNKYKLYPVHLKDVCEDFLCDKYS